MARINLCPNPSCANNANDYFGGTGRVTGVLFMPRTTGYASAGPEATLPRGAVTAGVTYRFSAYVQGNGGNSSGQANINWYSNGAYLSSAVGVPFEVTDGQVARVDSGARQAPTGADQALLNITGIDAGVIVSAVLYSPSAALTDYFDGDSTDASWAGTAGSSTSSTPDGDDGTETPPPPNPGGDPGSSDQAGITQSWGDPIYFEDFDYTGAPDGDWGMYDGPGHVGNGLRRPSAWSVSNGTLKCFGNAGGTTGGMAHLTVRRQYGRWEARMRAYHTGGGPSNGARYHPVLIVWPDSDVWPNDGEYDWYEGDVGDTFAGAFIHYPHPNPEPVQQEYRRMDGVAVGDWHNYAFEWQADGVTGYIDGRLWYRMSGGGGPQGRSDIQNMPSGHLTIQLDNFNGGQTHREAIMEVDWVRIWTHTSFSTSNNITVSGIARRNNFGSQLVGNRFRMYLTNDTAPVSVSATAGWEQTSGAVSRLLGLGRGGSNAAVAIAETSTSNQHDVLLGQWVSQPMTSGGQLRGAFNWVVARQESSADADLVSHAVLKVVSGDGLAVRGVAADIIHPTEWGTTLQAISVSSTITNPVTCLAGDRLVFELGYRATNLVGTSFTGTARYGGVADLESNDIGTATTTLSPWVNFADDGVEALFRGQTVTSTGIATAEAFGSPTLVQPPTQDIDATGIASAALVPSPVVVAQAAIVAPSSFGGSVVGTPAVTNNITLAGIAAISTVGSHRVRRATDLFVDTGIASGQALGNLTLVYYQELDPTGILSGEAFGTTDVEDPNRRIVCFGIASTTVFGTPTDFTLGIRTQSVPPLSDRFGRKRLAIKAGSWQLVQPTRIDRYRMGAPTNVIYVKNVVALSVLRNGNTLTTIEYPTTEQIESADDVWLGGHANITTDTATRDLWLANGYEVEIVY